MSTNGNNIPEENDEMSLREMLLIIQQYFNELLKNWKLIGFFMIPFILFFLFQAFTTPKTYKSKLTFMINKDEGGSVGGAMAILGQFGIGGAASGGSYNLEKVLDLSKSRRIIQKTLFDSTIIDDRSDLIANHLIDLYDFHEKWEEAEATELIGFRFSHDSIEAFNRFENTAFLQLYKMIIGGEETKGLYTNVVNENTGIMTLGAETLSESLSIDLLNSIFTELGQFYIDKTIEKQKLTYDVVQEKVDSIKIKLDQMEYALANFKDTNRGIYSYKSQLREQKLMRDIQVLTFTYGEALKNLEIADFTLKSKTPFIQLIDAPIAPIKPTKESKIIAILLGIILGGGLAVTFIIARKILRDTLNSENNT